MNFKKRKVQEEKNAKASVTQSVLTVELRKRKKFPADSGRAEEITQKVMEFIALDDQPFCGILEHTEPRCTLPSRRHFANVCDVGADVTVMGFLLVTFLPSALPLMTLDTSFLCLLRLTTQWTDQNFSLMTTVFHSEVHGLPLCICYVRGIRENV